jgi:hypothetical protein
MPHIGGNRDIAQPFLKDRLWKGVFGQRQPPAVSSHEIASITITEDAIWTSGPVFYWYGKPRPHSGSSPERSSI